MEDIHNLVIHMEKYNKDKKVRELLLEINPLLARETDNIRAHLEALLNNYISEESFQVLEAKIFIGKMCLEIERLIPESYVTMLFYNSDDNKIHHGSAPNIPIEFFDFFHDVNKNNMFDSNCGSCGYAVHNKKEVITDILTSDLWKPVREQVLKYGFKTGWSIPILMDQKVIGTFAIYHKFQKNVTNEEIQLVKQKIKTYHKELSFLSKKCFSD